MKRRKAHPSLITAMSEYITEKQSEQYIWLRSYDVHFKVKGHRLFCGNYLTYHEAVAVVKKLKQISQAAENTGLTAFPCDVCWTNSWAPCAPDHPEAVEIEDGTKVICQMCWANKKIGTLSVERNYWIDLHDKAAARVAALEKKLEALE